MSYTTKDVTVTDRANAEQHLLLGFFHVVTHKVQISGDYI